MGLFKKLKDILYDEEEYTEQIKITPEMRNEEIPSGTQDGILLRQLHQLRTSGPPDRLLYFRLLRSAQNRPDQKGRPVQCDRSDRKFRKYSRRLHCQKMRPAARPSYLRV